MTKDEMLEEYDDFCKMGRTLIESKNHDYAGTKKSDLDVFGNLLACEAFGVCQGETGLLVRILDKIARLKTFVSEGTLKVKDESTIDSAVDAHNYLFFFYLMTKWKKSKKTEGAKK